MVSNSEYKMHLSSKAQTISEISSLTSCSGTYLKVRRLMDDPNSTIEEFCDLINGDPNLSSNLLKIINSTFFGFTGQIDSVSRGVDMLGIGQLSDLLLDASAITSLDLPNDITPLSSGHFGDAVCFSAF